MAGDVIDKVDSTYWKSLRRIPDNLIRGSEGEDGGKVYSATLRDLQIRLEVHEAFFDGNVRPFRNKKENSTLMAKGDDESLLKLSTAYLRAYGNLVWGKDRKWLFGQDQLHDGEAPLRHIMPKYRSEGDHDRCVASTMKGLLTTNRRLIQCLDSTSYLQDFSGRCEVLSLNSNLRFDQTIPTVPSLQQATLHL